MAETDFLSFLVEETLKLQSSGEVELSSLELKLSDYALSFLKGEFIPQCQILRFKTTFGDLDVPVTWSIFAVDNINLGHIVLDKHNDVDAFFSILRRAWNPDFEKILVTHADGFCYIVGLKVGEETCLHDLTNPQEWLKSG